MPLPICHACTMKRLYYDYLSVLLRYNPFIFKIRVPHLDQRTEFVSTTAKTMSTTTMTMMPTPEVAVKCRSRRPGLFQVFYIELKLVQILQR